MTKAIVTFASYVLPPLLFYFAMAVMAITPQTRTLRVSFWPVVAFLAWRAAFSLDMPLNGPEERLHIILAMSFLVTKSLYWALAKEPLVRKSRPANSTPSTLLDAIDLAVTLRGHDWDWSHGLYVPRETRPTGRIGFVSYVALSAIVHAFIGGVTCRAIDTFSPFRPGSIVGVSIFDDALPWHVRYLRSSIITVAGGLATYCILQTGYDLCTLVGVLVLGQDPTQWPPGFDAPWRSTSLTEFWGRRWHQWLRHIFLVQGGLPLSLVFGRPGLVVGAFLSSAAHHHIEVRFVDGTAQPWKMFAGFGMMAPGILAERTFKRWTGRNVCGIAGWVWMMTWLVLWGNLIVDEFVRGGLFRSGMLMDVLPPVRTLVERLVMDFEAWLHLA